MSVIVQFLHVAGLIAGMILLRLLADELVARSRIRAGIRDDRCGHAGCFRACNENRSTDANGNVRDKNAMKRSACRAP